MTCRGSALRGDRSPLFALENRGGQVRILKRQIAWPDSNVEGFIP